MVNITIEYVILLPVLVLQIFLFPLAVGWLMNIWVTSRQTLALQNTTSHMASVIEQLYFSINHPSISTGEATYSLGLPVSIESLIYTGTGNLQKVNQSANSTKILTLAFALSSTTLTATSSVVLGPSASWKPSTFMSNSTHACVSADKLINGTIILWFGE
jgi:hypothetical protein